MRIDGCISEESRCDALHREKHSVLRGLFPSLSDADFVYDDMPFFNPQLPDQSALYLVQPSKQRGIQCRFGAKGLVAENHFDNERNFIAILGGERRYILGHPKNCKDMVRRR